MDVTGRPWIALTHRRKIGRNHTDLKAGMRNQKAQQTLLSIRVSDWSIKIIFETVLTSLDTVSLP
jgi:hypothetical protein